MARRRHPAGGAGISRYLYRGPYASLTAPVPSPAHCDTTYVAALEQRYAIMRAASFAAEGQELPPFDAEELRRGRPQQYAEGCP